MSDNNNGASDRSQSESFPRPAATVMLQGTASDVGKSLLTAAFCRIFKQDGKRVAPFKSQNMSLNSYVTPDGKEIGRAQGMQADACGIAATTDMNPILLKPKKDMVSQVVVHGKPLADFDAREYRERYLPVAGAIVREAFARLRDANDVVVLEGAGSPAEVNLKDKDIVNMRLAGWVDAPVLLVADIDRGGVFASVVGTMEILEPEERERVKGIIINKFRGDVSLLTSGLDWLEQRIGKPVLGVVPYLEGLRLEDEDGASLDAKGYRTREAAEDELDIAVIRLPRISNFTDFDPLQQEPGVVLRYVRDVREWGEPDVVLIPGSKNTVEDLLFLRESGLESLLLKHIQKGGRAAGICAGYQMMGDRLLDPDGVESDLPELAGLGLFPMETVFAKDKTTERVTGSVTIGFDGAEAAVEGYEIHMGRTTFTQPVTQPFRIRPSRLEDEPEMYHSDGAISEDGRVWGTYMHHIFHNDRFRHNWLNGVRRSKGLPLSESETPFGLLREQSFDRLADHVRKHVDMAAIYKMLQR
ncbi:cobyric acid synthase [Paenibacillus sp. NEAU-GSW1]|uniref:cobyric acid synthase n=1 Tax=Paenibacillus sp. NEAU-GSW1 TaxID=2682486 RepID=UPI0012E1B2FE|nr:cobyric acid synthase [Paenibacillus sp. NEAU-GSW1]MUT64852.1 cobyric acid synthase [Paenibacillus sp. NEAU-GSW1]